MKTKCLVIAVICNFGFLANAAEVPTFSKPTQLQADGRPIEVQYGYAFPTAVDLNNDGLMDLVIGEYWNAGEMHYFENKGTKKEVVFSFKQKLEVDGKPLKVKGVGR